jgi:hypothetical protein
VLIQRLDLLITCGAAVSCGLPACLLSDRRQPQGADQWGRRRCGRSAHGWRLRQVREIGVQTAEHPLKRFAMVLEHVPAIGDLERSRGSVGGPAGILGRAVTRDHVDARMATQPGRECFGPTIGQEIDRLMLFEVNQDRSVDPPFLEGEIINTKHPWGYWRYRFSLAENP